MPVLLQGSCHCGAVRFTVESHTPVPYQVRRLRSSCVRDSHSHQLCVCSICRKVGGVGGSINLGAQAETLQITQGEEHIRCVLHSHAHTLPLPACSSAQRLTPFLSSVYRAVLDRDTPKESIASSERNFCSRCSAMLWLYDENWCVPLSSLPTPLVRGGLMLFRRELIKA